MMGKCMLIACNFIPWIPGLYLQHCKHLRILSWDDLILRIDSPDTPYNNFTVFEQVVSWTVELGLYLIFHMCLWAPIHVSTWSNSLGLLSASISTWWQLLASSTHTSHFLICPYWRRLTSLMPAQTTITSMSPRPHLLDGRCRDSPVPGCIFWIGSTDTGLLP